MKRTILALALAAFAAASYADQEESIQLGDAGNVQLGDAGERDTSDIQVGAADF
jgi:Ni/Co efflux regulator RcnB